MAGRGLRGGVSERFNFWSFMDDDGTRSLFQVAGLLDMGQRLSIIVVKLKHDEAVVSNLKIAL